MDKLAIILLVFSIFIFSTCMREEGCLDPSATNFAPEADKDCADTDCCEYPKIDLRFFVGIDTDFFYSDVGTTRFRVNDIRFFISNVQLIQADGSLVGVNDIVTLEPSGEVVEDNYTITDLNGFSYEIGDLAGFGDFTGVRFNVGLDAAANTAEPDLMPTGHALGVQEDTMYVSASEGYAFQQMDLNLIAAGDTTSQIINVLGNDNLATVVLADTFTLEKSFGAEIQLNVDYLSLFSDIDFAADNDNLIIEKIVNNTPGIFSIR